MGWLAEVKLFFTWTKINDILNHDERICPFIYKKKCFEILKISYFRNGIENAKHWADTNIFTNRNDFYIEKTKDSMIAYLNISEARQSDKGPYRCRVDFWKAATRNIKITVNLAEEPKSVQIFNGQEKEMQGFISTRVNSTIRQD